MTRLNKYLILILTLFCTLCCFSLFSPIEVQAEEETTYTLNFYDSDGTTLLYQITDFQYGDYIIIKDLPFTIPDGHTHFTGWHNEETDFTLVPNNRDNNGTSYYLTAYYGFTYFHPVSSVTNFYPQFGNFVEIHFYGYTTGSITSKVYMISPNTEYDYSSTLPYAKTGYDFVGWKIDGTSDSQIIEPKGIATENVYYRPVFKKQSYPVYFYDDDRLTLLYENSVLFQDRFSFSFTPSKNYAQFLYWLDQSGNIVENGLYCSTASNSSYSFYAVYEYEPLEVTFTNEELDYTFTKTMYWGDSFDSINFYNFTGYTFSHVEDINGNQVSSVTGPYTYYMIYNLNDYILTLKKYNPQNGDITLFKTFTYKYKSVITFEMLPQPTHDGYYLDLWIGSPGSRNLRAGESFTMPSYDYTLTAYFEPNKYIIDIYYADDLYTYELPYNSRFADLIYYHDFPAPLLYQIMDSSGIIHDWFDYRIPAHNETLYCILAYDINIRFWDNQKVYRDDDSLFLNTYSFYINSKDFDSIPSTFDLNFSLENFRTISNNPDWNFDSNFYIEFVKYSTDIFRCTSGLNPKIEFIYSNYNDSVVSTYHDIYVDFTYLVTYQTHNKDGSIFSEFTNFIPLNSLCPFDILIEFPDDRLFLKWQIYKENEVVADSQVTCYVTSPLICKAYFYDEDNYQSDDYYEMLKVDDYFGFTDDSNSWLVDAFMVLPKLFWNFLLWVIFKMPIISDILNFLTGGLLRMIMFSLGQLFSFFNLAYIGSIAICFLLLHFLVKLIGGDS